MGMREVDIGDSTKVVRTPAPDYSFAATVATEKVRFVDAACNVACTAHSYLRNPTFECDVWKPTGSMSAV